MKLPELVYQDESRNNRSCRVGDRDADPYAKCSEPSGKNQQAGNEEQHLPGERKKDRLLRHPDGKEKVCRHHLETDNRKDRKDDMQTVHRRLDQLRIGRKHADDHRREQLTEQKPCCRHPILARGFPLVRRRSDNSVTRYAFRDKSFSLDIIRGGSIGRLL